MKINILVISLVLLFTVGASKAAPITDTSSRLDDLWHVTEATNELANSRTFVGNHFKKYVVHIEQGIAWSDDDLAEWYTIYELLDKEDDRVLANQHETVDKYDAKWMNE